MWRPDRHLVGCCSCSASRNLAKEMEKRAPNSVRFPTAGNRADLTPDPRLRGEIHIVCHMPLGLALCNDFVRSSYAPRYPPFFFFPACVGGERGGKRAYVSSWRVSKRVESYIVEDHRYDIDIPLAVVIKTNQRIRPVCGLSCVVLVQISLMLFEFRR